MFHLYFKKIMFFVFFLFAVRTVTSSLTTDYYQNLINQRTSQAQLYELPQDNGEFKTGTASDVTNDFGSYDFIIIGAGSAGSVLATRLSEINNWNILLLEAGGEEDDFNIIPGMFPYLQFSEMNWGYLSTTQTNCCLGMKDNKCMAPRGKSIGGSSAINAVLYVRGNAKDYDKWVEMGNQGWSYEEVLPYFIKSENSQIDGDEGYHGRGGLWGVEYASTNEEMLKTFIDANAELNQRVVDYNGMKQTGVSKAQLNIKHGKRQSAATAFLDNARRRKNLTILTHVLVTKIIIDENIKRVLAVEFVTRNEKFTATSVKEVIVSAGAINSPQLLMLSGIGPRKHLEDLGIHVIQDLPVGENLSEHPQFLGLSFRTNTSTENSDFESLIESYLNGLGPLTITAEALGFLSFSGDNPMIKYIFNPPSGGGDPLLTSRVYNFNEELTTNYLNTKNSLTDFSVSVILLHQKSRGRVTLKSSSPLDFPNIDLNLFYESEDIDYFILGIESILQLIQTDAFRKLNATFIDIPICEEFKKYSTSYWECAIRHMSMTLYHPSGTTAMGPSAVVDTDLKVHGIENLRVVDAGIIPSTVSGPLNAPVIMVAEKISDKIKATYGLI